MSGGERGVTLTEVLIASALTVIVVMGINSLDITRFRIEQDLRQRTGAGSISQREAALAVLHLSKALEQADRANILNTGIPGQAPFAGPPGRGNLQVRIPTCPTAPADPTCFDAAANFRWDQYRFDPATQTLRFYSNTASGCTSVKTLASQIESLTIRYMDRAPAPPGGDPFGVDPSDNNMVQVTLRWNDGAAISPRTHEFQSEVAVRGMAYSDVNAEAAGAGDSGSGLAPLGVSSPPGGC